MTSAKAESGERKAESQEEKSDLRKSPKALWLLGLVSLLCYLAIAWLSRQFGQETLPEDRPTLWVLAWYALAFACYWVALVLVLRRPASRWLLISIFLWSALFRAVLLPSLPVHEIDIYRYIWDGAVLAEGVSPYRFTPQQVLEALEDRSPSSLELSRLVHLHEQSPSLAAALARVHYGDLPSPYPIVSQAVFATAAYLTPDTASPEVRLVIMKELLVAFDLATLLVVVLLLGETGRNRAWCLVYGWSPLVMKEIASSGHLDSIAIFLTTLAIWLLVRTSRTLAGAVTARRLMGIVGVGMVLALAAGAKLYPLVLVPLFLTVWWRRFGWIWAGVGMTVVAIVASLLLRPLLLPTANMTVSASASQSRAMPLLDKLEKENQAGTVSLSAPPLPADPQAGIRAFFQHWEMNDLLFMVLLENLRPQVDVEPRAQPWFVLMPDAWSRAILLCWSNWVDELKGGRSLLSKRPQPTPRVGARCFAKKAPDSFFGPGSKQKLRDYSFLLTRAILSLIVLAIAWRLAFQWTGFQSTGPEQCPAAWCRAAMLTLAWFWLLCPTQNPWYWCWVVPLLPFAHYRAWHAVAACTMLYYLRFWLSAHFPEPPVAGTRYDGENFFYFVIVWLEFLPCLLWLFWEWLATKDRSRNNWHISRPLTLPSPQRGEGTSDSYFSNDPNRVRVSDPLPEAVKYGQLPLGRE